MKPFNVLIKDVITMSTVPPLHASPRQNKIKNDSVNEGAACCLVCGGVMTIIGLLACTVTWLVYSIIGLSKVSDSTIRDNYNGSLLWRYVLVMTIFVCLQLTQAQKSGSNSKDNDLASKMCSLLINLLLILGLASWGTYEIWGRSYDESLTNYLIYECAHAMVIYQWTLSGLIIGIMIAFQIGFCLKSNKPSNKSLSVNTQSKSNVKDPTDEIV